jgi:pathogenesis-related protein 1
MFVSTNAAASPVSALQNWEKEKAFWNNKAGTCQAGKTCTHFTQMVWRATTQVGCGINRNATGNWKLVMVCNYDPGSKAGAAY